MASGRREPSESLLRGVEFGGANVADGSASDGAPKPAKDGYAARSGRTPVNAAWCDLVAGAEDACRPLPDIRERRLRSRMMMVAA